MSYSPTWIDEMWPIGTRVACDFRLSLSEVVTKTGSISGSNDFLVFVSIDGETSEVGFLPDDGKLREIL